MLTKVKKLVDEIEADIDKLIKPHKKIIDRKMQDIEDELESVLATIRYMKEMY
jgi:hypothetical protein